MSDPRPHRLPSPRAWPLAALVLAWLLPRPAAAYDYSTAIYIEGEEDLFELYYAGLLEEQEFETLLELLDQPLDVNTASRDELYDLPGISRTTADAIVRHREEVGPFEAEWQLIELPGVGDAVFEQIRPFVINLPPVETQVPIHGLVQFKLGRGFEPPDDPIEDDHAEKTHSIEDLGYGKGPDSYVRGRVTVDRWLDGGIQALIQEDTASAVYDPESRDFTVRWGTPAFVIDKGYVSAQHDDGSGIAGTYSVGFGRRLTFDVTDRTDPHGWYRDLSITQTSNSYGMLGEYNSPQRLFGGAARLTAIRFGRMSLDMTVFGSSRLHDLYQYHLGLPVCESDEDVSPRVYVNGRDGTLQKVGWVTLPNAYREDLVGGNVTFRLNSRSHVGVTGYVAHIDKTVIEGVPDNQEWRFRYRIPNRDYFGAVGIDGRLALGLMTLSGEYAHNDNNGNAGLVQVNLARPRFDLDFVFRHYDTEYDNPHARGVAADDLYGGLRASDETGWRFKGWVMPLDWLQVRAMADLWRRHSLQTWNSRLYGKLDVSPTEQLRFGGYVRWTNKDLLHNGRSRVYGGSEDLELYFVDPSVNLGDIPDEEIEEGAGAKTQFGIQADVYYIPRTHITLYYQRSYEDVGKLYPRADGDGPCEPWFQVGNFFWVKARVKPGKLTTVTYRFKVGDEDVHGSRGGKWMVTYLQLDQKIGRAPDPRVKFQIRGSLGRTLSDPRAEWYEDCRNAGVPQLNGTCLDTDADEEQADLSEEEWYGHIWGGFEFRF